MLRKNEGKDRLFADSLTGFRDDLELMIRRLLDLYTIHHQGVSNK
jgi:hypothetical protein